MDGLRMLWMEEEGSDPNRMLQRIVISFAIIVTVIFVISMILQTAR